MFQFKVSLSKFSCNSAKDIKDLIKEFCFISFLKIIFRLSFIYKLWIKSWIWKWDLELKYESIVKIPEILFFQILFVFQNSFDKKTAYVKIHAPQNVLEKNMEIFGIQPPVKQFIVTFYSSGDNIRDKLVGILLVKC